MRFPRFRVPSKAVLRNVLHEHPVLDGLFAQVIYEPWFRILLPIVICALLSLPFLLFPLLKTSPQGFSPPIRVSGIDLIQAWSLKRTALREVKAGNHDRSVFTWRRAIANNPADADLFRELLRTVVQAERPVKYTDIGPAYSGWLLRL